MSIHDSRDLAWDFDDIGPRVIELLERQGWVTYRTLKRRFHLDEQAFATLSTALMATQPVVTEDGGNKLIWVGELRPRMGSAWEREKGRRRPATAPPSGSIGPHTPQDHPRSASPLVGREPEVALLMDHWQQAQAGQGQVVILHGEPGIGKSHLLQHIKSQVTHTPQLCLEGRCVLETRHSALYPVVDLFQRFLQYQPEDTPTHKRHKIEAVLATYEVVLPEIVPLLASLLSVPLEAAYAPLSLTPVQQKQHLFTAVIEFLRSLASQQAVMVIIEDVHWADASTLELLDLLVPQVAHLRLYLMMTCRPEFQSPWKAPHALVLGRLSPVQIQQLVTHVSGGKLLPPEVMTQIVSRTEGVPLFVEEMTKMLLGTAWLEAQGGTYVLRGPLPALTIPETLQESLRLRLAGLEPMTLAVAQVAATWGRGVTEDQVRMVMTQNWHWLARALQQLVDREFLHEVSFPPHVTYVFKHVLLQEAAYASMSLASRRATHHQIAEALEKRFDTTRETQPELLAYHYTQASRYDRAVHYWRLAGERAIQGSANVEALVHLRNGLALLEKLPDTPNRIQYELELLVLQGAALVATQGPATFEVGCIYNRARTLCEQVGDHAQLFPILVGLRRYYAMRGELQVAKEIGVQCLTLAQQQTNSVALVEAHRSLGHTLYALGEFVSARTHFEHGIALYRVEQHEARHAFQDPGVSCLAYAARTLWRLGYPDQALSRSQEAVTLAQRLSHSFSHVHALHYATVVHYLRREKQQAERLNEIAIAISTEEGFPFWRALTTILQGWVESERYGKQGLEKVYHGINALKDTGSNLDAFVTLFLVETYRQVGQIEKGLSILKDALDHTEKRRELDFEAELYRMKGELLIEQSSENHIEAESCFRQAIQIAQNQSAKSWELRAVVSLANMWQNQNKRQEAYHLLAPLYDWFTEGFDTADLIEAKTMLDELQEV